MNKYKVDPEPFSTGFEATLDMFDAPSETAKNPIPMLYQSGYLTIKNFDGFAYTIGFPNEEVRLGFLKALMPYSVKTKADGSPKKLFKIGVTFDIKNELLVNGRLQKGDGLIFRAFF